MKILIIDTNLALPFALAFSKQHEVDYFIGSFNPYPTMEEVISGWGFREINKISNFVINNPDFVFIVDVGFGGLADFFRKNGIPVFNGNKVIENLETDRAFFYSIMQQYNIPVAEYHVFKSVEEAIRFAKEHEGEYWVYKPSYIRGSFETFISNNSEEVTQRLLPLSIIDDFTLVAEKKFPDNYVEIGFDSFFNGKEFYNPIFFTIEIKGAANFTMVTNIEDSPFEDFLNKIKPFLQEYNYRGMFNMEGFYNPTTHIFYPIDATIRNPFICSYAYVDIPNLAEFMYAVARGEDFPELKIPGRYSLQVGIYTDNPTYIREIEAPLPQFKPRRAIKHDNKIFYIPNDVTIGAITVWSNEIDNLFNQARELVEKVKVSESYQQLEYFLTHSHDIIEMFLPFQEKINLFKLELTG